LDKLTESYSNAIQSDTLTGYQNFLILVDTYKNTIILPENKKILENYKKIIESRLELAKIKVIRNKLKEISEKIQNLPL